MPTSIKFKHPLALRVEEGAWRDHKGDTHAILVVGTDIDLWDESVQVRILSRAISAFVESPDWPEGFVGVHLVNVH